MAGIESAGCGAGAAAPSSGAGLRERASPGGARTGARLLVRVPAAILAAGLFCGTLVAGNRASHVRSPGRRPKIEMVAEGDPVFRLLPPDAIAAIDAPEMIPANEAAPLMKDEEPVVGLLEGREARAYPIWMLDYHEVVNDRLAGEPIAVTWCPLAGTGIVYRREVGGKETTMGVSGALWRDSLVLFDRESGSYWSQVSGAAIRGPRTGEALSAIPSVTTLWGEWRRRHPDTLVLRPDDRSREGSPFADYNEDPDRLGITRSVKPDRRMAGKRRVVGIHADGASVAIPLDLISARSVVQGSLRETPVAIVSVASRGALGFDRRHEGRTLDFEPAGGERLRDLQTGSLWDPETGRALDGPLVGGTLRRVDSRAAYWFVWAAFHPGTEILAPEPPAESGTDPSLRPGWR